MADPATRRRSAGKTSVAEDRSSSASCEEASDADRKATVRNQMLRQAILDRAVDLFHANGFAETSLSDIATSLDLTRGAIYYYYRSKDDILRHLVEAVTLDAVERYAPVSGDSWAEQLRAHVGRSVLWLLERRKHFRLLTEVESRLPDDLAQMHLKGKREVLDHIRQLLLRGRDAGEFAFDDPAPVAFAIIGMMNWSTWWFQPDGRVTAEAMAATFGNLAVKMVTSTAPTQAGLSDAEILDRIEGDVAMLKARVQPKPF